MTTSDRPNGTRQPRSLTRGLLPPQRLVTPVLSTEPVSVEKGLAIQHGTPILPARHPNLGLAPFDMKAGFVDAAARVRARKTAIATQALDAAVKADPSFRDRYDDAGLRHLIHDGELLVERLATSLAANDVRWIAEYCEWVVPIYRRKRISLVDLAAIARSAVEVVAPHLNEAELAAATRALDAADVVLRRNGRVSGDRHKRRPLLRWLYRGV